MLLSLFLFRSFLCCISRIWWCCRWYGRKVGTSNPGESGGRGATCLQRWCSHNAPVSIITVTFEKLYGCYWCSTHSIFFLSLSFINPFMCLWSGMDSYLLFFGRFFVHFLFTWLAMLKWFWPAAYSLLLLRY
jgi:hypothetical protein